MDLKRMVPADNRQQVSESWRTGSLAEICSMKSGSTITSDSITSYDKYPCYGGNGLRGYAKTFTHNGDYPLIGRQGALCGNVIFASGKFFASEHAIVVTPNTNTDAKWLFYLLDRMKLNQYSESSAQPGLSVQKIVELPVVFPTTKSEQTAIATALSDADALIGSLEKLIAKKRLIKQGVMQKLLEPKEGWVEKTLGHSAIIKARIGWQGLTTAEYKNTGDYFLITGTEFKNGYIDWDKCFYVDATRYNQDKNIQVKEHDVLITKDGTIGKVALIKSLPKKATLNSGVFVLRPIGDSFYPEFFYYLLLSEIFTKFLKQLSAGSTINHLYQKDIVSFKFYTPKTITEQEKIADVLSDIDDEIELLEGRLDKAKKIKQGMMQTLLTGKIRLV